MYRTLKEAAQFPSRGLQWGNLNPDTTVDQLSSLYLWDGNQVVLDHLTRVFLELDDYLRRHICLLRQLDSVRNLF